MTRRGYRILHATAHFGGGVGSVLLNWLAADQVNDNTALCWDTANDLAKRRLGEAGVPLHEAMGNRVDALLAQIARADIVVIHFWNHPLVYDFLVNQPFPPARVVCWGHVSGRHAPYVYPEKLLEYPDAFIFTSPTSLKAREVATHPERDKFAVIVSTGGVERFVSIRRQPHAGFVVGYVGTTDHVKLHGDYVRMCGRIAGQVPDARFVVIATDATDGLRREVGLLGLEDRFTISGRVDDIAPYLARFDIFGYPLARNHFGTAEQVLQEAMAASLVPVVLDNEAEAEIVGDGGIVVRDPDEYVETVVALSRTRDRLPALGESARNYAETRYTLPALRERWQRVFDDMMDRPKKKRRWRSAEAPMSPYRVFLESLGEHAALFATQGKARAQTLSELAGRPEWVSPTKGTPFHYRSFFPDDAELAEICRAIAPDR